MNTAAMVETLRSTGDDYEWYPTTRRMVDAVSADLKGGDHYSSFLDIGAGDGRVLTMMAESWPDAKLYAIEKASLLQQQQPDEVIPVGTEFIEQDLMSLPMDVVFCNPPYSQYEEWAARIVSTAHTFRLYLVLPQRWEASALIGGALKGRQAEATIIHRDDFLEADRRARAVVHVIRITFLGSDRDYSRYDSRQDPFDLWFDQNIDTFDREAAPLSEYEQEEQALARLHSLDSIADLVAAFDEDYARMQEHYVAIFRLDSALLREVGVDKSSVREGLKKRMQGLKHTYWHGLFGHLDVVTNRLTTKTKARFLDRLTGQTAVAFTTSNAYAVVLWALKAANQYFDAQVVDVFRELSTHEGVSNYVSNQRTWEKDGWRYNVDKFSHYKLDYRIVLKHYQAIHKADSFGAYDSPGGLHKSCHEVIDDMIAVFGNLGFLVRDRPSRVRQWHANVWQDFQQSDGTVLFQVKGFINGNLHLRIEPRAIKTLNIEAGRLLGWLRAPADVVTELGYTADEAASAFGANRKLGAAAVKLLGTGECAA